MNKDTYKLLRKIERAGKAECPRSISGPLLSKKYVKREIVGHDNTHGDLVYSSYVVIDDAGKDYLEEYRRSRRSDKKATISLIVAGIALIVSIATAIRGAFFF